MSDTTEHQYKGEKFLRLLKNKTRSELIIIFISLLLASVPILFGFYYIHQYGVNIPLDDQWSGLVRPTINYYEGNFDPSFIISEQNDSRQVFINILMLAVSIPTGMNILAIYYTGYLIYCIAILIIAYILIKDCGISKYSLLIILPILYYAFNPYYLFRFIYNLWSLLSLMILLAVATIYLLDKSRYQIQKKSAWFFFALSVISGIMCSFSGVAGLSIWFAGLFQLVLQTTDNKNKKILIWIGAATCTFYTYYIGLGFKSEGVHGIGGYSSFLYTAFLYPVQKILCFMGALGSEIAHYEGTALLFGIFLTCVFLVLLINNRDNINFNLTSKWFGLLAFGILNVAELALTRSGSVDFYFGPPDSIFFLPSIRHSLAIFLPVICMYALALIWTRGSIEKESLSGKTHTITQLYPQRESNIFLLGMVFTLLLSGTILHVYPGLEAAEDSHDENIANQYYLINYRTYGDVQLGLLHKNPNKINYTPKMEYYHLGVFSGDPDIFSSLKFRMIEPTRKMDFGGNELRTGLYTTASKVRVGSYTMPAILEHTQGFGSILIYKNIPVPHNSHIDFYTGIDENAWYQNTSDGVTFEIMVYDQSIGQDETIFSEKMDPVTNPEDRYWHHHTISMEKFAGREVDIKFVTLSNKNNNYDLAWWGDPKFSPRGSGDL